MRNLSLLAALGCAVISTFNCSSSMADDWPHWMGPKRDNVWRESGIIDSFPKDGPKILWRSKIAGGYSGPSVVGDQLFITDYVTADNVKVANFERKNFTGTERIICLNAKTGKQIWKHEHPVKYTISYPAGPRCTPVVDGDNVYTLGAEGHLFCFDRADGKIKWSKELKKEYNTKAALWGYAAHPLIDGDQLLTLAGGKDSHIVAFDKITGKELWKGLTSPEQGYSPPTIIEYGKVRQLILLRTNAVTSVNPTNGKEYWSVPYEATSGSIIMSPVMVGDHLYVGGYSQKSVLLKLNKDKPAAEVVWRNKVRKAISPVNVQPMVEGNVIYGADQNGEMAAVEIPSGKRLWSTSKPISERKAGNGTVFFVKQADKFWMFNDSGELIIARLSPEGYQELDRVKVIEPTNNAFGRPVVWSMPAFAHKCAFIRNDNEIICVSLAK